MGYKAGVVGAAGFAGIELVRILLAHPDFELICATSDANEGMPIAEMYPSFDGKCDLSFVKSSSVFEAGIDVAFLAVPHTAALSIAPKLIENGITVIDLSADFRLKDAEVYEKWYATKHTERELLKTAAFGLPEITASELNDAALRHSAGEAVLVACAGCYPTATSLAAVPALASGLVPKDAVIIADAISGVTGAGKKATERTHFCFANENLEAYGVTTHRHTPEIEQILGVPGRLVFTPHLAPLNRGLLSTVNIPIDKTLLPQNTDTQYFCNLYADYYEKSPFVEVLAIGKQPRTSSVAGTNNARIGIAFNESLGMLIATGAIDNLGKGAAGQAVQCANIVFGLPQESGLMNLALPV